jgi:uncharacterized protein YuzE
VGVVDEESDGMRLTIDRENDAVYLRLDDSKIMESEEVQPGVILDFNAAGNVVGVELLNVSSRLSIDSLKTVQLETA